MFAVVWIVFAIAFIVPAIFHLIASRRIVPYFEVNKRPLQQRDDVKVIIKMAGSDLDQPLKDFTEDFNLYLDGYNQSSRKQHIRQAIGYFISAATCLFSFLFVTVLVKG